MSLTLEEKDALRHILTALFDDHAFMQISPNERTLSMTDTMLIEISECNKRVERLLQSLPCAIVARGFLRRCLVAAKRVIEDNRMEFQGCRNYTYSHWKRTIYVSAI